MYYVLWLPKAISEASLHNVTETYCGRHTRMIQWLPTAALGKVTEPVYFGLLAKFYKI
jgi:hypothetical protein